MNNETKRDVFDAVWNRLAGYQVFFNGWPRETLDGYKKRYDAALPDDLPVIPKAVGEYIKANMGHMRGGFTLHFGNDSMFDEEWLLDDRHVKDDELRFLGYDANMCALPNLSNIPEKHRREVIEQASMRFKNINADVWLDDCKIKVKINDR